MRMFVVGPWQGASNDRGVTENALFSHLWWIYFCNFYS